MLRFIKRLSYFFLLLLFCGTRGLAQENVQISILTCAPGEAIYSVFGHSAIRIVDYERGTDVIYDFGSFNFDTPNFALKFLKGKLKYHLGKRNPERFIQEYSLENRLVEEQVLNLNAEQKQQIIDQLNYMFLPENRYYYYSFLEKNCSTDLRDLLEKVGVSFRKAPLDLSKRDQINDYMKEKPWLRFGVNLILGTKLDVQSSEYQSMFLPDYLRNEIEEASNGEQPLVASFSDLNSQYPMEEGGLLSWLSPLVLFSALLLICLLRFPRFMQGLVCLVIGLIGLLIVSLWLFSDHPEVKNNWMLLLFNPLYLLYIPLIIKRQANRLLTNLLAVTLIGGVLVWVLGVQAVDIGLVPFILLMGLIHFKQLRMASSETLQVESVIQSENE